jgi:hypothetical protein
VTTICGLAPAAGGACAGDIVPPDGGGVGVPSLPSVGAGADAWGAGTVTVGELLLVASAAAVAAGGQGTG